MTEVIGYARDYVGLVQILELARRQLEVPYSVLDDLSGLPERYTQKVLQRAPDKRLGPFSLGRMLKALGLRLIVVVDQEQREKNQKRRDWRPSKPQGGWKHRPATREGQRAMRASEKRAYPNAGRSEWGREMQARQMVLLTPDLRKKFARKAGKASGRARRMKRWRKANLASFA